MRVRTLLTVGVIASWALAAFSILLFSSLDLSHKDSTADWFLLYALFGSAIALAAILLGPKRRSNVHPMYYLSILLPFLIVFVVTVTNLVWRESHADLFPCSTDRSIRDVRSCAYSEKLDKVSAFYFVMSTMTTVGYGDIHPVSSYARWTMAFVMAVTFIFFVVGLSTFFFMVGRNSARRGESCHNSGVIKGPQVGDD